ncbi:hypothetical protein BDV32DRAFT_161901 [Aspergillus pseudonomiae]|nr:hypothetical protein BDV32DRAFT_161901 [Aspergillus pseudonomiae]
MASQLPQIQESFRASCDCCRAKKLACVISTPEQSRTAGQQFAARKRARVTVTHGDQTRNRFEIPGDPQQPAETGRALISSELLPSSSMDLTALSPSGEHIYGVELPPLDDHILHNFSKDEEKFFQQHLLANHFDMSSLPLTAECTYRSPLWVQGSSEPQDSSTDEGSNSSQFQNASVLVTEIHEQTVLLKGDSRIPSLGGAEEGSDKYPVGPVLRLTRKLAAELRHLWQPKLSVQDRQQQQLRPTSSFSTSTYPVCPESMDIFSVPRGQQAPSEVLDSKSIFKEMPDLATNLLMLTGYASLAKLYTIVFSQIHNVLKPLPESVSSSHHTPSHDLGEAELLQPGELLAPTSNFEACSRVYITVQMLLDEFQAVEDIVSFTNLHDPETSPFEKENNSPEEAQQQQPLGPDLKSHLGGLTRQIEMVRAGLKEDISRTLRIGSQRELSSVLQYGHYLKVLLRERMGL